MKNSTAELNLKFMGVVQRNMVLLMEREDATLIKDFIKETDEIMNQMQKEIERSSKKPEVGDVVLSAKKLQGS
jgi:hypothetical protein